MVEKSRLSREKLREVAHKAAQIGFTYGALGRDFEYVYKNVEDMLKEIESAPEAEVDVDGQLA